jgi:hypothetical protein
MGQVALSDYGSSIHHRDTEDTEDAQSNSSLYVSFECSVSAVVNLMLHHIHDYVDALLLIYGPVNSGTCL